MMFKRGIEIHCSDSCSQLLNIPEEIRVPSGNEGGFERAVAGLFRSYFSRGVEKLPSLENRKSITGGDSRRAKLMALPTSWLAGETPSASLLVGRVRDGFSLIDKRSTMDRVVHKSRVMPCYSGLCAIQMLINFY